MSLDQAKAPPESQGQGKPDEAQLQQSVGIARKVVELQATAASLKERAKNAVNPKERLKLFQQAYEKEVEAFGQSKLAKRLQSGAWQGVAAGGGIGGGVALGLGTLVGTLVSGIVAVPTVLVGGLVGAGVGGVHGPFITFGKKDGKKDDKKAAITEEETKAAAMKEAEMLDQAIEKGASTMPQPPQLEEEGEADEHPPGDPSEALGAGEETVAQRKRPRKLQVRSSNDTSPAPERKKPRKIQVRSGIEKGETA